MKLQEGPLFGALLIGAGLGFLVYNKTQNMAYAALAGVGIAVADYVFLAWINLLKQKKK